MVMAGFKDFFEKLRAKAGTKPMPWITPLLMVLFVALFFISLGVGSSGVSFSSFTEAFTNPESSAHTIIMYLRMPRVAGCILAGVALAIAGMILQTMLNNSLASPGIVGINSGAGLAVVLSALIFPGSTLVQTISTFLGAFCSALLIYGIARVSGASRGKLILAGVAISRLFSALIDTVVLIEPSVVLDRVTFQLGTMTKSTLDTLTFAGPIIAVGIILALILSRNIGLLTFGDDMATSMGMNVKRFRFLCLLAVAFLSAGAVCFAGLLSFLGLIVPHIVRRLIGTDSYFRLTCVSALFGAVLTMLCDLLARVIFMPYEIPVGVIMSVLGVPFFLFLLFSKEGRKRIA